MFLINDDDMSIYLTRGDVALFQVSAMKSEKEKYTFKAGDVVRIKVFEKKACENVVLQKDFGIEEDTELATIYLEEKETRFGEIISKPKDYWYEIELNPYTEPQTIVGYDEDGAKILKLFPEGANEEDVEIEEEDIPVVDTELDQTSARPVQNRAIAGAIVAIRSDITKTNERVNKLENDTTDRVNKLETDINEANTYIAVERARIDQLVMMSNGLDAKQEKVEFSSGMYVVSNGVYGVLCVKDQVIGAGAEVQALADITDKVDMFKPLEECTFNLGIYTVTLGELVRQTTSEKTIYLSLNIKNNTDEEQTCRIAVVYPLANISIKEVSDARVGVDGVVYDSLGEAVRRQVEQAMQSGGGSVTDGQIAQAVEAYFAENGVPNYTPVRRTTVAIYADKWVDEENKYSQIVAINGVTANTDVELKLSDEQVIAFNEKNVAFLPKNINGVVTVFAFGQKPQNDYTLQVILTEVVEV